MLAGCGYPGEPLPPALNRPVRVADLAAVERGSKIYIQFTVPAQTTEGMPVKGKPDIELRVGPTPEGGFTFPKWEKGSDRVPDAALTVAQGPACLGAGGRFEALWQGRALVAVQIHEAARRGRRLVAPDRDPANWCRRYPHQKALAAVDAPDAVNLEWHAAAPEFRQIFRAKTRTSPRTGELRPAINRSHVRSRRSSDGKTYDYLVQSVREDRRPVRRERAVGKYYLQAGR